MVGCSRMRARGKAAASTRPRLFAAPARLSSLCSTYGMQQKRRMRATTKDSCNSSAGSPHF
eukprot:2783635-Prymnesium_polylepis.2